MPTFILSLNWTDQGIRGSPRRDRARKAAIRKDIETLHVWPPLPTRRI
jgi:uncharacterized protein with GYD domain